MVSLALLKKKKGFTQELSESSLSQVPVSNGYLQESELRHAYRKHNWKLMSYFFFS